MVYRNEELKSRKINDNLTSKELNNSPIKMKKSSSNTRLLPPKPEKKLNKSNSGVTFKPSDLKMSKEIPKVELPEAPKSIKRTPPINDVKD